MGNCRLGHQSVSAALATPGHLVTTDLERLAQSRLKEFASSVDGVVPLVQVL